MTSRDDIRPSGDSGLGTADAQLLEELVGGLAPVRPVASLRTRLLLFVAAGLGLFFSAVGIGGLRSDLLATLTGRPEFLATFGGLAGLAVAGALAGLAASTPGRQQVVRHAVRFAFASFGVAVLACLLAGAQLGFARESSAAVDWMCLRQSLIFGALPALIAVGLISRGWVERPGTAAVGALASAAALGALLVHVACQGNGPVHLLGGHLAVPVLASVVLGLPLARAFERWGR